MDGSKHAAKEGARVHLDVPADLLRKFHWHVSGFWCDSKRSSIKTPSIMMLSKCFALESRKSIQRQLAYHSPGALARCGGARPLDLVFTYKSKTGNLQQKVGGLSSIFLGLKPPAQRGQLHSHPELRFTWADLSWIMRNCCQTHSKRNICKINQNIDFAININKSRKLQTKNVKSRTVKKYEKLRLCEFGVSFRIPLGLLPRVCQHVLLSLLPRPLQVPATPVVKNGTW